MLSIGEFSRICKVSTKTLRYYAEIGLILPSKINPENNYRYYTIEQLDTMLLINRLKCYQFSLEEIKEIMNSRELIDEKIYYGLLKKKDDMEHQINHIEKTLNQIERDLVNLSQGKSMMSYLDEIQIELVEVEKMYILSIRKMIPQLEIPMQYTLCFQQLIERLKQENIEPIAPPMVLFHTDTFRENGLDIEFAFIINKNIPGSREFFPGLCIKTKVKGSYTQLSSVYAKQIKWAFQHGYQSSQALYEMYLTDPSSIQDESDLVTEVYYPIQKMMPL